MITETIFIILLSSMLVFLVLTLCYKNPAFGAFTIIISLLVATQLLPVVGGIMYNTGSVINASSEPIIIIEKTTSTFTNTPLATLFFLVAFYLIMQIITFRKEKKQRKMEEEYE